LAVKAAAALPGAAFWGVGAPFLDGLAVFGLSALASVFLAVAAYFEGFVVNGDTVFEASEPFLDDFFSVTVLAALASFLDGAFLTIFLAATLSWSLLRSNGLIFFLGSSRP
jgi:hypothetical protein